MTPQEWIESTKRRWGDSGHLYEGAQHLAAALEEIARLQAENALIRGAMDADDERLMRAWERIHGTPEDCANIGCDAPEWMADEILRLKAQLSQAEAERVVCGYRFNTYCLCSVPASRVLKDGEVGVSREEWEAANAYITAQRKLDGGGGVDEEVVWHRQQIAAEKRPDALRAQGKEKP